MKLFFAIIAICLFPLTALAECDAPFPASMFEEQSDGTNCPATSTEKAVGGFMFATVFFVAAAEMLGADIAGSGGPIDELGSAIGSIGK